MTETSATTPMPTYVVREKPTAHPCRWYVARADDEGGSGSYGLFASRANADDLARNLNGRASPEPATVGKIKDIVLQAISEGPWSSGQHMAAREAAQRIAALVPDAGVPGWRSMDSAPRDGTQVLVTGLCYGAGPTRFYECPAYVADSWRTYSSEVEGWGSALYEPTHWQPLRPPPTTAEDKP